MLVLTRKTGEAVAVGDQVIVRVLEVNGNKVKLGIDAPNGLRIYREEIFLKVQEQNRQAASWNMDDFNNVVSILNTNNEELVS